MAKVKQQAVAYYRTSSAANSSEGKDSKPRQAAAVADFAKGRFNIVASFYDAAVSGADPVDTRPGFRDLLAHCADNNVAAVIVENASRFARDLAVQIVGHDMMQKLGLDLIAADAPTYFTDPSPTAVMVRQILGSVAQFEKAQLVAKLKHARDAKRAATGRCEGRKPVPDEVVATARRLYRRNPKTSQRRSLREIAAELSKRGLNGPSGGPYHAGSVKRMLG